MTTSIPLVDLRAQFDEIATEVREGIDGVMATTAFIGGPQVSAFESEYAAFVGTKHCIGVGNGTDALEMAFRAVGVGPGAEVVVPANTFIATAEAVVRAGGAPVFVDVRPDTLLLDPTQLEQALSTRTRAVAPVSLFGQVAEIEQIERVIGDRPITVVEDAAQSQGAERLGQRSGAFGRVAATSFYPGKNLGAAGDAGAVTTDDDDLARAVRLMGAHGCERKYDHESFGFNSRLDTLQAVVLSAKLRRLKDWNARRAEAAARYDELLAGIPEVRTPITARGNAHVWHLYVVRMRDRDRALAALHAAGIGAGIHYPVPVHLTRAFAGLGGGVGAHPVAEAAAGQILSLPLHPHLTSAQQERVVDVLRGALG
ncbi:MAG: DegT/DnrJ/EryC1/StrS family aminotransferase [Intrasporangium sp.]|uniref:DegT/DnrJ/EryC1/StrS family aminotransferase n=1 Tax=Intrasporangium sp. TaxID=1925024 RepID=UPI002648CC15|nr:DegT/DnrJ/EryC1/StrS family aminotransferase [Intrasporangium sp.]MDN5796756.1 DegT/DnrJ/EryC1/StrS family aminotransferase [Intrasporangium sp.]